MKLNFWGDVPGRTIFILVSGKAGVGKSALGSLLAQHLTSITNMSIQTINFADAVKVAARKYFSWDNKKDGKGRKLLQQIGMVGREYDKYNWAKKLIASVEDINMFPPDVVIVSDWRFPNELEYIKNSGFQSITVRVTAPEREILKGTEYYNDPSETSLENDSLVYDYIVDNSGDYEELKHIALEIIKENFPILKET